MARHIDKRNSERDSDDEPLHDQTGALTLSNKRTERMKRKDAKRQQKRQAMVNLSKLPTELLLDIMRHLEPHDVFDCALVNRRFHALVRANDAMLGTIIISQRYSILAQCFPTPFPLSRVAPHVRPLLTDPARQTQLSIHKRPYQHIHVPDAHELCTCLTCILLWNNLCLVLDFAYWQDNLDTGEPIPTIPRGHAPAWNAELVAHHARIARRAVYHPLWHARILQIHLDSTKRAIRRHVQNKGNKRLHVTMTAVDTASGTDSFLAKHAPASIEFPYQRDEYYMLEAYLPNRWWRKTQNKWVYNIAGHERDIDFLQSSTLSNSFSIRTLRL